MLLTRQSILKEIEENRLIFTPKIDEGEQVGHSSVDLRLSNTFIHIDKKVEELRKAGGAVHFLMGDHPWAAFEEKYATKEQLAGGQIFTLVPGKLVLGFTAEYIQLPPTLAGRVEGKSGLSRRGLLVHLTAPTLHVGWAGQICLEMYNVGPVPLDLKPGNLICQLILETVTMPEQYEGQFQGQTES